MNDRTSTSADRSSSASADDASSAGSLAGKVFDPLSDVLRAVRLAGALFFRWEVSSPFATSVPRGDRFAAVLLPGAQRIVSYHVVVSGSCWGGLIGEAPIQLQAGDVLLVPRGDAYVMASSAEACRCARLDEEEAIDFFRQMGAREPPLVIEDGGDGPQRARIVCGFLGCDLWPFNPVVNALPGIVRLRPPGDGRDDRISLLASYAVDEAGSTKPGTDGVILRLGELMYVEVIRRCLSELADLPVGWLGALGDPIVARCLALMHGQPSDPWTLQGLARSIGTSRSALAHRFVARVGVPPLEYLTRWRMQLAANLLGDSSLTIAAIAGRVGYGSGPAFSRAFTRLVGQTPSQWRAGPRAL